ERDHTSIMARPDGFKLPEPPVMGVLSGAIHRLSAEVEQWPRLATPVLPHPPFVLLTAYGLRWGEVLGWTTGMDEQEGRLAPAVDLYWIPLGAGAHFVRLSGKLYEALKALGEHRPRLDLYHSALQIWLPDDRFVIECAAILNLRGEERGVVAGGAVAMSWLGR